MPFNFGVDTGTEHVLKAIFRLALKPLSISRRKVQLTGSGSLQAKGRPFLVKFPDQTSKQIRLKQRICVYKARPNIFANYIYLIAHEQLRYEDEVSLTQLICDTYRHLLEARQNDNQRTSYGSW